MNAKISLAIVILAVILLGSGCRRGEVPAPDPPPPPVPVFEDPPNLDQGNAPLPPSPVLAAVFAGLFIIARRRGLTAG